MNIKLTLKSLLFLLLSLGCFIEATAQTNTGEIRGVVYREGRIVADAHIVLVMEDGDSIATVTSAINGEYKFVNVYPGQYYLRVNEKPKDVSKNEKGWMSEETQVFDLTIEGKKLDIELNHWMDAKEYNAFVLSKGGKKKEGVLDQTGTTNTKNDRELKKTGLRSSTGFAGLTGGVTQTRNGPSGRGSRADATAVFIDGVRVNSSALAQSMNSQVDIMQAGIPAMYGDFTGLGISITTKGGNISARKAGSLEVRSSSMFNPYHSNLIEGFYATPILWKVNPDFKTGKSTIKKIPIASMNFGANFSYIREPSPSYIGYYVIKDDVLAQIEKAPLLINSDGAFVHSANYLTENDFDLVKVRPNVYALSTNANAKFDFKISDLATLTVFGNFAYSSGVNGGNNLMAYKSNPYSSSTYTLGYIKYTQSFKGPDSAARASRTTLNNTTFTMRLDYQSTWGKSMDNDHRENVFDYGYIGQFQHYPTEFYSYYGNLNNPSGNSRQFIVDNANGGKDTLYLRNFWEQVGFRDTAIRFTQANINTVRGNYTQDLFDKYGEFGANVTSDAQILQGLGLLNGYSPNNIYSLWNTPGTPLSSYSKSQSERYTIFAMGETEVKGALNSASKAASGHKLQFGVQYEQSAIRGYGLAATNLWRQMYLLANSHIAELDKSNPILSFDANGVFQDTIRYNRLINSQNQTNFDKTFRNKLISEGATDVYGNKVNETTFIDINSYKPSDFTIDMFSADELLNNGSSLVQYYGYDHLGNRVKGRPSVNDFLQDPAKRAIGAFMPIYTAAWFQDQFNFKDLEFRLGLRIERYDANQSVLKDPYSLYPIKQAGEVNQIDGIAVNHPSNIGDDYAVYVDDVKNPRKILGYRKENVWYDENGTQLATPDLIANRTSNGKIAPYLVDPNNQNLTENSFTDYKPKVNILPRVFFKFPLNQKSLFYASYDVLAQRPSANFATIDDYYFMTQKATNGLNNPALISRITTDYQIGFKQQLSPNTLL
ncbi:MAG: hypothetical protein IT245_08500, partial [Bacteroidia bacterium]|nr:hypothetical protein [Bacteroidia bacterium]